jgi:hypothetical protein
MHGTFPERLPKANDAAGRHRFVDGSWDLIRFRLDPPRPGNARRNLPFRKQSYARQYCGRFSGCYERNSYVIGEHKAGERRPN